MGVFKDKHGKTMLGTFIAKAAKVIPDIADAGIKLGTGNIIGAIGEVGSILGKHADTNAEAKKLLIEFERDQEEMRIEAFKAEAADRDSARSVYKDDSIIQKLFSIVFLVAYFAMSWYMLDILLGKNELPKLAETMITMIWTGTSAKLNTIVDFLFGGSMSK